MKKLKHNHKGTKLIKLSLFASMMFAPILAVLFKCAYVTFNKNAYLSYSNEIIQRSTLIENDNSWQLGATYQINYFHFNDATEYSPSFDYSSISLNPYELGYSSGYNYDRVRMRGDGYLYFRDTTQNYQEGKLLWGTEITSFTLVLRNTPTSVTDWTKGNFKAYLLTYSTTKLDNAFEYAINELEESNLFNWTKTAALYTPTQAMTTGMGIQTNSIAMIITYWMYITAIYIVIDIVVELFTYITHTITGRLETD